MIDVQTDVALSELRGRLARLITTVPAPAREFDAIISHIEVNDRHGVGVVLRMLFKGHPDLLCIRSRNAFNGENQLGERHLCINSEGLERVQAFGLVSQAMTGLRPRRILCSPYYPADVWNGLILKYLYGVPLCLYVMDDQSVTTDGIPAAIMAEALRVADLRLAISQEMVHAYEVKYGQKFWLVPPVVAPAFIPSMPPQPNPEYLRFATGVLVGNVWSGRWLRMLRTAVREAGVTLHWYGDDKSAWSPRDREAMAADGIVHQGFLPNQEEFVARLRQYPYAVLATSPLDGNVEDETPSARAIAKLSLPSRLPFLLASTHAPIIVLGSPATTASRFVERFQVGQTIRYDARELQAAVAEAVAPERQTAIRTRAGELAPSFSAAPVAEWIWQSLALGRPADDRYERLMPRRSDEL